MPVDFEKYEILNKLEETFRNRIRFAFVFDFKGSNTLIITNDNQVYAIGENNNGELGLGHNQVVKQITSVPEMSDTGIQLLSNGLKHVIGLSFMRSVYCWGSHQLSQTVDEDNKSDFNKPEIISYFNNKLIIDICCGAYHSLALSLSGKVYAWGRNNYSQIGNGSDVSMCSTPVELQGFNEEVIAINCGANHSLALTKSGKVFGWGSNELGQLGVRYVQGVIHEYKQKMIGEKIPKIINVNDENGLEIMTEKITCGQYHSLLLSSDGHVYGFGWNLYKQTSSQSIKQIDKPLKLEYSENFVDIASHPRLNISCGLTVSGIHIVWGECGDDIISEPKPTNFSSFDDIFAHYFGITYKRIQVFRNDFDYSEQKQSVNANEDLYPKLVGYQVNEEIESENSEQIEIESDFHTNEKSVAINAGIVYPKLEPEINPMTNLILKYENQNNNFCNDIKLIFFTENDRKEVLIVTKDDLVYVLEPNQLSNPSNDMLNEMTAIEELSDKKIIDFSFGSRHAIAMSENGDIFCWGDNGFSQLGNGIIGKTGDYNRPKLNRYFNSKNITSVKCGSHHSMALSKSGKVYVWGHNNFGQIGNSCDYPFQVIPIELSAFKDEKVITISCGFNHCMVLTDRGHVFSWGSNMFNQLGVNKSSGLLNSSKKKINYPKIIHIKDEDNNKILIDKISCGKNHSLLLSRNGNIYSFGCNRFGQLGNGSRKSRKGLFRVYNKAKFIDIKSNFRLNISIGLSNEGILYVWGQFCNEIITSPKQTNFSSFYQVLHCNTDFNK